MPAPTNGIFFLSRRKETPANTLLKPSRMNTGSCISSTLILGVNASEIMYGLAKVQTRRNTINRPNKDWGTGILKKRRLPHKRKTAEMETQHCLILKTMPSGVEPSNLSPMVSHSA